jgi:hypothetical protein
MASTIESTGFPTPIPNSDDRRDPDFRLLKWRNVSDRVAIDHFAFGAVTRISSALAFLCCSHIRGGRYHPAAQDQARPLGDR